MNGRQQRAELPLFHPSTPTSSAGVHLSYKTQDQQPRPDNNLFFLRRLLHFCVFDEVFWKVSAVCPKRLTPGCALHSLRHTARLSSGILNATMACRTIQYKPHPGHALGATLVRNKGEHENIMCVGGRGDDHHPMIMNQGN